VDQASGGALSTLPGRQKQRYFTRSTDSGLSLRENLSEGKR
jgi:hypothetical protein